MFLVSIWEGFASVSSLRSICLLHLHPWPEEGCVGRGAQTPRVAGAGGKLCISKW